MSKTALSSRAISSRAVVVALITLALAGALLRPLPASAAPAPIVSLPANAVTADRLPTAQIDGVVWSTAIVGNTVYAGGRFSNARPAGAAPGTSLKPRGNLLAFDVTTGVLVDAFAPSLNAQVMAVAASPDGSRVYVVGDFTTASGQARRRVAAYSTATGQLISAFNPSGVNSQARAVVATNDTVYVGGGFAGTGDGSPRSNLAAFRASDGALLAWNPNADYTVWALAISGDGASVFAGGSFQKVGGQPAYGLAKINAVTGALQPWTPSVRNAGPDAGISSLRVQGDFVYGTSWHYGPGGNLEGTFKVPVASSDVEWVTDCHGDNYSSFMSNGVVYSAGHAHYCGNMGGGFPQYTTWKYQHAQAWTDTVGGDILNDVHGYFNWHGKEPGPSMVHWLPSMGIGSFTGQYQAGWTVIGNNDYIVFGGEFPSVNGVGQQGLVRFARKAIAPGREGPQFVNGTAVPKLVPTGTGSVRVTWPAGYDRDDSTLSYRVIRDGAFNAPRHTATAKSNWWTLPALGFVDTGLTAGATYRYQIVVSDPGGNTVTGGSATVTMPTSWPASSGFAQAVRSSGATMYWPLDETSGLAVTDLAAGAAASTNLGVTDGRADTGVTWNQSGATAGGKAAALGDNNASRVYALGAETAPDTFTTQVWIRTTSFKGGRIFGFGDLQTGNSGHRDRHLYMTSTGRLVFGVRDEGGTNRTITSPLPYNTGQWYLVHASMGPAGLALSVNGAPVASSSTPTRGEAYLGHWRLGGDDLRSWPSAPSNVNFIGSVDDIAVYPTALTNQQMLALYQARNAAPANQPPTASFTSSTDGLTAAFDGSGSSDGDGTIAGYAWNFGDGASGSGASPSHPYATAGTYTVTLTVTDDDGATASTSREVTVSAAPPSGTLAADAFNRTVSNGWGQADVGGAWTHTTATSNFAVANGAGTMSVAAGSGPSATLGSVSGTNVEGVVQLSYDKPGTGGGLYTSFLLRRVGTSDYRAKVRMEATRTTLQLTRMVNNTETVLATQIVDGAVMAAGDQFRIRFRLEGTGTTTLSARLWKGATEPSGWTVTATDATSDLQRAGAVGLYVYLSGSATNSPIRVSVGDLDLRQLP